MEDDDAGRRGSSLNEVDQQVFYQILQNTAKTAEEVSYLRKDLHQLNEANSDIESRVSTNEDRIHTHDIALRVVTFFLGAGILGFGSYIWTIL